MNITNTKKYLVPAAIGVILVIALPFYFSSVLYPLWMRHIIYI